MKNSRLKSNFRVNSSTERVAAENIQNNTNTSFKAVKTMSEQLVIPPTRVWNKIEAILDEQDNIRKKANELIATSFGINTPVVRRKKVYLATVAGISLAAGVLWMFI